MEVVRETERKKRKEEEMKKSEETAKKEKEKGKTCYCLLATARKK